MIFFSLISRRYLIYCIRFSLSPLPFLLSFLLLLFPLLSLFSLFSTILFFYCVLIFAITFLICPFHFLLLFLSFCSYIRVFLRFFLSYYFLSYCSLPFFNALSFLHLLVSRLFYLLLLSFFNFIIFLFTLHFSHTPPFTFPPSVNLSHLYLPSHFHFFSLSHRHYHSFFSSIFLSRRPPSPLLISNTILGSLLTLFTFTRFSLYYLYSVHPSSHSHASPSIFFALSPASSLAPFLSP